MKFECDPELMSISLLEHSGSLSSSKQLPAPVTPTAVTELGLQEGQVLNHLCFSENW